MGLTKNCGQNFLGGEKDFSLLEDLGSQIGIPN